MGLTNFKHSLEKRYSVLTGELKSARAKIERIKREVAHLGDLEARIPKVEALIASAEMLTSKGWLWKLHAPSSSSVT